MRESNDETNKIRHVKKGIDSVPTWLGSIIILLFIIIALGIFWFIESQNFINEVNAYFQIDSDSDKNTDDLFITMNDFLNTLSPEEIQAIGLSDKELTEIFFENYLQNNKEITTEKFNLLTKYFLARNTVQDNVALNEANNLNLFLSEYNKTSDYFALLAQRQDRMLKILASIMSVAITIIAFLGYHNIKDIRADLNLDFDRLGDKIKIDNNSLESILTTNINTVLSAKVDDLNNLNADFKEKLSAELEAAESIQATINKRLDDIDENDQIVKSSQTKLDVLFESVSRLQESIVSIIEYFEGLPDVNQVDISNLKSHTSYIKAVIESNQNPIDSSGNVTLKKQISDDVVTTKPQKGH